MNLLFDRTSFEIPDDVTYLNCAYLSPMLKEVRNACAMGMDVRSQPWVVHPDKFFGEVERARSLFAQLIHGDPDGVALIPAASYGIGVAAANLPVKAGQKILVMEGQFPSNYLVWWEIAKRQSAQVEIIPFPKEHDWTDGFLAKIDERTAIVALEPCHWTNGSLVDLKKIREKTRAVGAGLVVDASQAVGAMSFNVTELEPDFFISVGYKWLLGPYGLGLLYAHPKRRAGIPLEFNWMNRKGSEDFSTLCDYQAEYQIGSRRYDMGERSNFLLVPMLNAALQKLLTWGVPNIQHSVGALTRLIGEKALEHDMQPVPSGKHAAHLIGLQMPGRDVKAIAARLAQEKIFVSARGSSIRISPHIYNRAQDIDRLFDVIDSAVNV